ncbi:alpha/beta hydrolase family protein [Pectobacterium fontis]|uniref:alpha/beta hydrolase family protein n=1 Tax=Pectobacterium fontis TaxID=2558042 RepID=UPI00068FC9A9|nr:prolyl oligopeptidase family serine peptidase [Pectobacterium fontis]
MNVKIISNVLLTISLLGGVGAAFSYPLSDVDLSEARKEFHTQLIKDTLEPDGKADTPPKDIFDVIHYPAAVGSLVAYVSPDPHDGKRHPAVVWAHGGYGGIGDFFWEPQDEDNDQSARAFREAGIVMMVPSWRGENDNPGKFEMFYGEVDDLHAAREYLSKLPYVDPERIYVAGHSTGGTMALLANEYRSGFRAAFSLGGIPDLKVRLDAGRTAVGPSFNTNNPKEFYLRSPRTFITHIKSPTFYFEGEEDYWDDELPEMQDNAVKAKVPFYSYSIPDSDHFNIILPTTRLIAQKILLDSGKAVNINFNAHDIRRISQDVKR